MANWSAVQLGWMAGMPLLLSVFAGLFGGLTTDRMTKRFGLRVEEAWSAPDPWLWRGCSCFLLGTSYLTAVLHLTSASYWWWILRLSTDGVTEP